MLAYARARYRVKLVAGRYSAVSCESNQQTHRLYDYPRFGSQTLRTSQADSGTCSGRMDPDVSEKHFT